MRQVEAFQRLIDSQGAGRATDLPPLPDEVQVIIEAKRLPPEQARALGLTPLAEREEGILVTMSPDVTLPILVSKAQSYISERTDSGNPRFGGLMAPIEQIRPAGRVDKAGERLQQWLAADPLDLDQQLWLEVELAGGAGESGAENRQQFFSYLAQFESETSPYAAEVISSASNQIIEPDYSLHRVRLPVRAVLDLLDDSRANWILSMELVPQVEDRTIPVPGGASLSIPPLPELAADAPCVVIIDSGVAATHPLFQDELGRTLIGRQLNFLPRPDGAENGPSPAELAGDEVESGHGTAIASIVAYGSLFNLAEAPRPVVVVESAKIFQAVADLPQLHPGQFPKILMREVVTAFHHPMPQRCKIFNLALGSWPHPRQTISNWAEELDKLAAGHDILFVIATGNLQPADLAGLLSRQIPFPDYLLEGPARLRDPGQAYNALTVGGLTAPPVAPLPPWRAEQPLAPAYHPAPFTRSGAPVPGGIVKPDVVEFSGNLSRKGGTLLGAPELAELVANRDFVTGQAEQPFSFHYGTGLAGAKVSHLAGLIQAQYPRASANLIRALIVNSAEWPVELVEAFSRNEAGSLAREARQTLLRLCGYGRPQTDKALSANARCMVFVREDQFTWRNEDRTGSGRYPAKVSFYAIRLQPDDLFRLPPATPVRVSVTLAYNPTVRKSQRRRYQSVDMRWELKRREESSEDFYTRWMLEAEANDEEARDETDPSRPKAWPWQLKPVLNPGGRVRRGTMIRDWFDLFGHDLPSTLEIVVVAMVAPWQRPPEPLSQNFALVVSIEALDESVPIYDTVRVQVEAGS
jgi:hypothetical protein